VSYFRGLVVGLGLCVVVAAFGQIELACLLAGQVVTLALCWRWI
jgi:hypothetical protein